jgi:hypothetical protein
VHQTCCHASLHMHMQQQLSVECQTMTQLKQNKKLQNWKSIGPIKTRLPEWRQSIDQPIGQTDSLGQHSHVIYAGLYTLEEHANSRAAFLIWHVPTIRNTPKMPDDGTRISGRLIRRLLQRLQFRHTADANVTRATVK